MLQKTYFHQVELGEENRTLNMDIIEFLSEGVGTYVADNLPNLKIDLWEVQHAMLEILKNSYDGILERYMRKGELPTGFIKISIFVAETKNKVVVTVRDNGAGIVKDKYKKDYLMGGESLGEEIIIPRAGNYDRKYSDNGSVARLNLDFQKIDDRNK